VEQSERLMSNDGCDDPKIVRVIIGIVRMRMDYVILINHDVLDESMN
jgi:hypothetical protein